MTLGMEVGLSPGDFVLDGDSAPLLKKRQSPQFSANVYCGQTAAWIKMPLGTEVGFGLRDIVLNEDPAPPLPKGHSPQFSANVRSGQMAGWTKTPLGMEVDRGPGETVCSMGTQLPQKEGTPTPTPPNFWPMSIVAKRLDGSRCHLVRR